MEIVYKDSDIIVINKPAGIPVETKNIRQKDCESELKKILAGEGIKNPYLAVINRLDQPVNGLVLFALNKEAAAKLSKDLTDGKIEKFYKAEVFGEFEEKEGTLEDMIYKDGRSNQSFIVSSKDQRYNQAKKAILHYKEEEPGKLDIKLVTGRHHQIRVQLANAGHPILGDTKYGNEASREESDKKNINILCLTSYRLSFKHPKTGKEMEFIKE
jgi:23S rRNA pseudouridine1911/1915/1917 synthase